MPTPGFELSAGLVDFSQRFTASKTVAASPSANSETVIASITIPGGWTIASGVMVWGWAAWTQGTNGTGATLKIRQTGTSGTVIASTGIIAAAATVLESRAVEGFDTSAADSEVYVLTLLVTAGSATSTVSGVSLSALVV